LNLSRTFGWAIAAIALVIGLATSPTSAQDFPALGGRVVDAAEVMSDEQVQALSAKLEALENATLQQFVVATVADLEGYDIADYGYRLGREWALGDAERNDGLMLLVAPNERKVRIEVGYGLEGTMTDAFSQQIIDQRIIPRFKAGDLPGGIVAGADAVIAHLTLPDAQAAQLVAEAEQSARSEDRGMSFAARMALLIVVILNPFLFFILPMIVFAKLFPKRYKKWKKRRGKGGRIYSGSSRSYGGYSSGGSSYSGGGGSFGGGGASGSW